MSDILFLYGWSVLMLLLTFGTSDNKAPIVSGIVSLVLAVVATTLLIKRRSGDE